MESSNQDERLRLAYSLFLISEEEKNKQSYICNNSTLMILSKKVTKLESLAVSSFEKEKEILFHLIDGCLAFIEEESAQIFAYKLLKTFISNLRERREIDGKVQSKMDSIKDTREFFLYNSHSTSTSSSNRAQV